MIRITCVVLDETTNQSRSDSRQWDDDLYASKDFPVAQRREALKNLLSEAGDSGHSAAAAFIAQVLGVELFPAGGGEDKDLHV